MLYGIASYKRPDCRTVWTLREAGVRNEDIIISTQTEEDYAEYKNKFDCEVIYASKDSAAGNRNTILGYVKGPVILLDDDVTGFHRFTDGKWKKDTAGGLASLEGMFTTAEINNCCIYGVSPNTNGIITRCRYEYDINTLLQGTVIGVLDKTVRFDERWKMVEDYELCLRMLRNGKTILRANYLCAGKPKNGTNAGGLHERYASGQLKHWIEALERTYPEFKANKNKDGGQMRNGR